METKINLIVDGELVVESTAATTLAGVKAVGTRLMRQHGASSAFFVFEGANWLRQERNSSWGETGASAPVPTRREEPTPESDLKAVPEMDDRFDELPDALEAKYADVVVTRNDCFRLHSIAPDGVEEEERPIVGASKACRLAKAVSSAVSWCVTSRMEDMVAVRDSRNKPVAMITEADGVLVRKSLVRPEAESVEVDSMWSCVAIFRRALASAILLIGTAAYAVSSPASVQACETWDVAPATHQEVLGVVYREAFHFTMPDGRRVDAVGEDWPTYDACARSVDQKLVSIEADIENAMSVVVNPIIEKAIGSCEAEPIVDPDARRRPASGRAAGRRK